MKTISMNLSGFAGRKMVWVMVLGAGLVSASPVLAQTAQQRLAQQQLAQRIQQAQVQRAIAIQQAILAIQVIRAQQALVAQKRVAQPAWMNDLQRQMPQLFQKGVGDAWLAQQMLTRPQAFQFGGYYGGNVAMERIAGFMNHAQRAYNMSNSLTQGPLHHILYPLGK